MNNSIINDLRHQFRSGNVLSQLIIINVCVFIGVNLFRLILLISGNSPFEIETTFNQFLNWVALPMDLETLLFRPWTLITHIFLHYSIMHILWNMLMLYIFGRIFQEYAGNRKFLPVYVYGGLAGAIVALLTYHLIPGIQQFAPSDKMLGASAGVTAIVIATATLMPDYFISLIFIGTVRLKYIAVFVIIIDIVSISSYTNVGGHFAHIGGALFGFIFIQQYKKGNDLSLGFNNLFDKIKSLFKRSKTGKMKVAYKRKLSDEEYNVKNAATQKRIDEILDKISKSGYESLSKQEKEILFKMGNNENKK